MRDLIILLAAASTTGGCAFLEQLANDPEAQEQVLTAAGHAATGNWAGVLLELGKLVGTAATTYVAVNMRRNRARRLRGEPVKVNAT